MQTVMTKGLHCSVVRNHGHTLTAHHPHNFSGGLMCWNRTRFPDFSGLAPKYSSVQCPRCLHIKTQHQSVTAECEVSLPGRPDAKAQLRHLAESLLRQRHLREQAPCEVLSDAFIVLAPLQHHVARNLKHGRVDTGVKQLLGHQALGLLLGIALQ